MGKSGKTLSVFLTVISVLLLSLTTIVIFFFSKERDMRKDAERQLAEQQAIITQMKAELKDANKKTYVFEEKSKEAEERVNTLLDDLELERGLREQIKSENIALKKRLEDEKEAKDILMQELADAREKILSLTEALTTQRQAEPAVVPVSPAAGMETGAAEEETVFPPPAEEQPVQPEQKSTLDIEGKVLSVNKENQFIIFDVGSAQGMEEGVVLSVFHDEDYLGDVRSTRVEDNMTVADIIPPLDAAIVSKDDRVVIKQ